MLARSAFATILALAAAAMPLVSADYPYDERTKTYQLGEAPAQPDYPKRPAKTLGACGGADVKNGDMACAHFGTLGNAIYKCKDGVMTLYETCYWSDGAAGGACSRNQLKKGSKFYPLVSGDKVVCVLDTDLPKA